LNSHLPSGITVLSDSGFILVAPQVGA